MRFFLTDEHWVKSVRIRSYSGPHLSRIFLHFTPYLSLFSTNAGKCGKNADQNNSEYELFFTGEISISMKKFWRIQ